MHFITSFGKTKTWWSFLKHCFSVFNLGISSAVNTQKLLVHFWQICDLICFPRQNTRMKLISTSSQYLMAVSLVLGFLLHLLPYNLFILVWRTLIQNIHHFFSNSTSPLYPVAHAATNRINQYIHLGTLQSLVKRIYVKGVCILIACYVSIAFLKQYDRREKVIEVHSTRDLRQNNSQLLDYFNLLMQINLFAWIVKMVSLTIAVGGDIIMVVKNKTFLVWRITDIFAEQVSRK